MGQREYDRCSVRPYEGDEKYIFISYSHKDSPRVFPIIEALDARGYRIWYDEGIDPGSEWPETIASHLGNAHACLAFISNNSVDSHNCRREINFALSKSIGFLSVMLEDTALSPGLEMQLSPYQSIFRSKLPDDEAFLKKLTESKILEGCRALPVKDASLTPADGEGKPAPEPIPEPPAEPQKAQKPKKTKTPKQPGKKLSGKKKALLIGIPAAAVVLLAVLLLIFAGKGGRATYEIRDITAGMLYGDKCSVAAKDAFIKKTEFRDMLIDHKTVNVSSVPFAMDANPANTDLMQLIFLDKFETEYAVYGRYAVKDNELTVSYAESGYYPDASPVADTLTFALSAQYGRIGLTADDGSSTEMDARYTIENDVLILDGAASGNACGGVTSFFATGLTSESTATSCEILFEDGKAVDPAASVYGSICEIGASWQQVVKAYNGREETFSESGRLQFRFVNTHPYGFVMIDESGTAYNYQAMSATSTQNVVIATLYFDEELTDAQRESDLETLQARLDTFFGQGGYRLAEKEDRVYTLTLPKEKLQEIEIEEALKCYFTRPIELFAWKTGQKEKVAIPRSEILAVEPLDHAPASYTPKDDEECIAIKLTLSESVSSEIQKLGSDFVFAQDMEENSNKFWYYYAAPGENATTYYLICSGSDIAFAQMKAYDLTHAPLTHAIGVEISMDELIEWETAGSETFGQKQCNATDFVEPTITYLLSNYSKVPAGTLSDDTAEIRARLDLIDLPYAFGQMPDEEKTILAIKTPVSRIDSAVMKLIGSRYSSGVDIQQGFVREDLPNSNYDGTSSFTSAGNSSITLQTKPELLAGLSAAATEASPVELQLIVGGYPLLSATTKTPIDDGKISFSAYANTGKSLSSTGADWLAALLDRVFTESALQNDYGIADSSNSTGRAYQFNPDRTGSTADETVFLCSSASIDKKTIETIEPLVKNGEVWISGAQVYINLRLPFDDKLVKTSTEAAKTIYQALDLETLPYDGITIYLAEEDEAKTERARIFFNKRCGSAGSETYKPGIYVRGIFCNGRAEQYQEAFLKAVNEDSFFSSKVDPNSSSDAWTTKL